MAGRPAKPVQLHLVNGNKRHLTKKEIAARQAREQKLKSCVKLYKPNAQVEADPTALAIFKKLKKLYKSIEFVEGLDEMVINRYCLLSSQAIALERLLNSMNKDVDKCEEFSDRVMLYKAISGTLAGLNKLRDMLVKLEDRLFLNPIARIKNVPRPEKPQGADPNADLFD